MEFCQLAWSDECCLHLRETKCIENSPDGATAARGSLENHFIPVVVRTARCSQTRNGSGRRHDGGSAKRLAKHCAGPACIHQQRHSDSNVFVFMMSNLTDSGSDWRSAGQSHCFSTFHIWYLNWLVSSKKPLDWLYATVSGLVVIFFCSLRLSGSESPCKIKDHPRIPRKDFVQRSWVTSRQWDEI